MHLAKLSNFTLCQLSDFIASLEDNIYQQKLPELSNASIGQHSRHIIEFYTCLLEQINAGDIINYDKRARKVQLETSTQEAIDTICSLSNKIKQISTYKTIAIEGFLAEKAHCLPSSVERELLYVLEHAVHHMAIIKIATKILNLNIELPENFGVAASTLIHKKCAQ